MRGLISQGESDNLLERQPDSGVEVQELQLGSRANCSLHPESNMEPLYRPTLPLFCCTNINEACLLNLKSMDSLLFSSDLPFSSHLITFLFPPQLPSSSAL